MLPRRHAVAVLVAAASIVATAGCSSGTPKPHVTGTPTPPSLDPFYTPPTGLKHLQHGAVIRTRAATLTAAGLTSQATATTVLFASTDIHGTPIAASATVLTPHHAWTGRGSRPLIAVQPAYDSLGSQCEPSYALQANPELAATTAGEVKPILATGAEIVVPDYEGPNGLFAIGDQQGRIVLDAMAAAEQLRAGGISTSSRVSALGYSGGGLATAWAAELQPSYASSLHLIGVVEGGVPADIKTSIGLVDGHAGAFLGLMALVAIERAYPNAGVGTALNSAGRAVFGRIDTACAGSRVLTDLAGTSLNSLTTAPNLLANPRLQPVFAALRLGQHTPTTAIYNFQGTKDEVVGYAPDLALVKQYCSEGVTVDFVPVPGADHVGTFTSGASGAGQWLVDLLDGKPAPKNCPA